MGGKSNLIRAKAYMLQGAQLGDTLSQFHLAKMYQSEGRLDLAAYWYKAALNGGMYRAHISLVRCCADVNLAYVKPEVLTKKQTEQIASELSTGLSPLPVQEKEAPVKKKVVKEKPEIPDFHGPITEYDKEEPKLEEKKVEIKKSKKEKALEKAYLKDFHKALELKSFGYYKESFKIFKKYADLGKPEAQYNVAQHYRMGWGVKANIQRSAVYYGKAAVLEHAESQLSFALVLYELKESEEVDFAGQKVDEKIYFWANRSAENGNEKNINDNNDACSSCNSLRNFRQ